MRFVSSRHLLLNPSDGAARELGRRCVREERMLDGEGAENAGNCEKTRPGRV